MSKDIYVTSFVPFKVYMVQMLSKLRILCTLMTATFSSKHARYDLPEEMFCCHEAVKDK